MRPIHGAKRNMLQLAIHNFPEIGCTGTGLWRRKVQVRALYPSYT